MQTTTFPWTRRRIAATLGKSFNPSNQNIIEEEHDLDNEPVRIIKDIIGEDRFTYNYRPWLSDCHRSCLFPNLAYKLPNKRLRLS
jgi:hypothetical protein